MTGNGRKIKTRQQALAGIVAKLSTGFKIAESMLCADTYVSSHGPPFEPVNSTGRCSARPRIQLPLLNKLKASAIVSFSFSVLAMAHRMPVVRSKIQLSRSRLRAALPSAISKAPAKQRGDVVTASKLCIAVDVDEGASHNVTMSHGLASQ